MIGVYMYVLTSIYMETDMHEYVGSTYAYMYVGKHAYIYACKYVCMNHICMDVCAYALR